MREGFKNFLLGITIDLDSHVTTVYGNQQRAKTGFNPKKKGRKSHHPLMAFIGESRDFIKGTLRPGNRHTSYDARGFVASIIRTLPVKVRRLRAEIPRDRKGSFKTQVIPRSKRYENEIRQDLSLMFLTGISTRTLSMLSTRLIGRKISPTEISSVNKELIDAVEKWRNRDLSRESIKYLFLDGVCFPMRIGGGIEIVPVLVVIGVTETGHKLVLALQAGDKESACSWRELFKDLKNRGLHSQKVTLGIMDGLPGLETVFKEEFPKAKLQRCQVHVARNLLAKVPKKLKQTVEERSPLCREMPGEVYRCLLKLL